MGWDEGMRKMRATQSVKASIGNAWRMYRELSMTLEEKRWVLTLVTKTRGETFACERTLKRHKVTLDTLTAQQADRVFLEFIDHSPHAMETAISVVKGMRDTGTPLPTLK